MFKKEKGITLVALVVTIIILLILAGVSIYFATNTGLIGKAQQAVDESKNAGLNENNTLNEAEQMINNYL
ncbi:MAG: type II secretion system protein [Clostridia bacterium]